MVGRGDLKELPKVVDREKVALIITECTLACDLLGEDRGDSK
jgi:hypothetical protein